MNFKNWFKKEQKIGLLPYISEPIYGLGPNDPQVMGWEIVKLNVPEAWRHSEGEGVVVAVLDTGCDLKHPDLQPNLLEGKNLVNPSVSPVDKNGHGTHVCSTIAACNNSRGMVGVAPKTKILPVKVLDDRGSGSPKSVVDGIFWAADRGDVNFITMSLGSPSSNPEIERAINYANKKGKIIFCAAGNSGWRSDIMYPAKYSNTIAIGAIDKNFNRTSFSCSGDRLDFMAPGHDIMGCAPNNSYALMSGTSMSNPFAVGIASLLLSYNNKHNKYVLKNYQNYVDILKTKTIPLANTSQRTKNYQGYGIICPIT